MVIEILSLRCSCFSFQEFLLGKKQEQTNKQKTTTTTKKQTNQPKTNKQKKRDILPHPKAATTAAAATKRTTHIHARRRKGSKAKINTMRRLKQNADDDNQHKYDDEEDNLTHLGVDLWYRSRSTNLRSDRTGGSRWTVQQRMTSTRGTGIANHQPLVTPSARSLLRPGDFSAGFRSKDAGAVSL